MNIISTLYILWRDKAIKWLADGHTSAGVRHVILYFHMTRPERYVCDITSGLFSKCIPTAY